MGDLELLGTTRNQHSYTLRLSPSYRAFKTIVTDIYGSREDRAKLTADVIGDGIERIMERGYLTKKELQRTIYPKALGMSELEPLKCRDKRDKVFYQRMLILK